MRAALVEHRAAVLRAPTGAGKTTRVPPALLDLVRPDERVVVLEPRRIAARAAARRIAAERGWRLGREVGYQVRFDRRAGEDTRLLVVTEGILVQRLQADPFLDGVGAVVFDELHERSLAADLALAMCRRVQREARPELALVAMSATLDPEPLVRFLGGCPAIESAGFLHPVEVRWLDPAERGAPAAARTAGAARPREIAELAAWGVRRTLADLDAGDLLAFLPGVGEIRRTEELLAPLAGDELAVMPLYGDLPPTDQDAVLSPGDRRRVILATNVAETSITIEGIAAVVDSGWARVLRFDPASGLDRLELARISRASAEQRAGRAGRLGPGRCLRLWSEHEHRGLAERDTPEIARVDLAGAALELFAWGEGDPAAFPWFETPDAAALERAVELLDRLGAVERTAGSSTAGSPTAARLTPLGRALAAVPAHPRLARLLLEGRRRGRPREAALLAACLAERYPLRHDRDHPPPRPSRSDLLDAAEAVEAFARGGRRDPRLRPAAARFVLQARDQLAAAAERAAPPAGEEPAAVATGSRAAVAELGSGRKRSTVAERSTVAKPGPGAVATRRAGHERSRVPERVTGGERSATTSDPADPEGPRSVDSDAAASEDDLLAAVLAAFPDRLARRRGPGDRRAVMVGGRGVVLGPESAVRDAELFVCVELADRREGPATGPPGTAAGAGGETRVRVASAVERAWLPPGRLATGVEMVWDGERERAMALRRTRYEDLVLDEAEVPLGPATAERAGELLAAAAAVDLDHALALDGDDTATFLARVRSLAGWMPELGLPRFGRDELTALLPALCAGRRSLAELRRLPLAEVLRGTLGHEQRLALAREAPERLEVPSGSRIRLVYEPGRPPVLAARIQEMFGLAETPRVAAGRVPVLLHLLAPNHRPQQVTDDLASFWERTYPEVRKELAGRYPKHDWPEDPWSATPRRRPGRPRR